MKSTKTLLGARIKALRKAKKLSQEQLAESINIESKHVSRIEVGKSYPSLKTLDKIADSLDVDIKDLFDFMPQRKGKELLKEIQHLLKDVDEQQILLIYKIVRSVVR